MNIKERKRKIAKKAPRLTEIIRGTLIKWRQQCGKPNCKCHKLKNYRHGPYWRISYGLNNRMHHLCVPASSKERIKIMIENYNKLWKAIEKISLLNIRHVRSGK